MWIERRVIEGETVKVEFAEWTNLGTKIGVLLRYSDSKAIIDFGNVRRHLEGCFLVYENHRTVVKRKT